VGYGEKGFVPCDAPVLSEALSDGTVVPYQRTFGTAPVDPCSSESADAAAPNNGSSITSPGGASAARTTFLSGSAHQLASLAGAMAVALHLL
jgi:hypothetical protein